MDVRVVIIYSDELKSITVDGIEMEGISSIKNKPIKDWFAPSYGRDGWEGLIKEIKKMIDDDEANLNFEFQGPKENKLIFEKIIKKYGYESDTDGLSIDEIAKIHLEDAKKAEHRGFYKKALKHYKDAAEIGNSLEALFSVGEYYFNFEDKELDIEKEEAITNAIEYYEKAANLGHTMSQYRLYEILSTDKYVNIEWEKALDWLKMAAESGDDRIKIELGDILYEDYFLLEDEEYGKEALAWYRKAEENENDYAFMRIARCYKYGVGVKENQKEAFKWYEKAAISGNMRGNFQCAECYYMGRGVKEDKKKSFELYKKAADSGEADACYMVGKCYEFGFGVEENQNKAFEWYLKSADEGNFVEAIFSVAEFYFNFEDKKIDLDKEEAIETAIGYYKKAATLGHIVSQYRLYEILSTDEYVAEDFKCAFEWLYKAAEAGYDIAQIALGDELYDNYCSDFVNDFVYDDDYDDDDDDDDDDDYDDDLGQKALKWYRKAAENNNNVAYMRIARCYKAGMGVDENQEEAFKWYKKAADAGNIRGVFQCAECYREGRGVAEDDEKAFELYKKAANEGEADACFMVGECYSKGIGVDSNDFRAFKWYLKSAEGNYLNGQTEVGFRYDIGLGVKEDHLEAKKWYLRAAERGDEISQFLLGYLYENGDLGKVDYNKAYEWYLKSASNGHSEAMFRLAQCYEYGKGVSKDIKTAYEWYKEAADAEAPNAESCYKIAEAYYAQKDPNLDKRTGVMLAAAVLLPVTNLITIPTAVIGSAIKGVSNDYKFLKSPAGKDMMKYYHIAASLDHQGAIKRLEELEGK